MCTIFSRVNKFFSFLKFIVLMKKINILSMMKHDSALFAILLFVVFIKKVNFVCFVKHAELCAINVACFFLKMKIQELC